MEKIRIDPVIYTSKPEDIRSLREMKTYELLDRLDIKYQRLDHEETETIESCHDVEMLLGIEICKNLFLCNSSKTEFYLLMMPGRKKFVTKELCCQINSSRLSFASAEYMLKFLNIEPGSVSVLGLMNDTDHRVKLLIDNDVLQHAFVGCHPCVNTSSLKIKTADLMNKFLPYTKHEAMIVKL
jgi:Ala-tRNA(Pro) deacylase